jgi:hypothetical protein
MSDSHSEDLQTRIHRLLDGEMNAQELDLLDLELQSDPEARKLYLDYAKMHSALENHFTSQGKINHGHIVPIERYLAWQNRRIAKFSGMAAAIILTLTGLFLWSKLAKTPDRIAVFQSSPDSDFVLVHSNQSDSAGNQSIRPGSRLKISSGTIEATFSSGVRGLLEAPCEVTFHDDQRIAVAHGVAKFDIPTGVSGFTVETRNLRVVDLGTAFGIIARRNGYDEVHVTKGSVEIGYRTSKMNEHTEVVKAGSARRFDESGKIVATAFDASRFPDQLIKPLKIRNSGFEESSLVASKVNDVGYGPLYGWAAIGAGVGHNKYSQPFLNQPAHEGEHVAFIQGKGLISQTISGFDPDKLYSVTYFVNERGLSEASTSTSVSLDFGATSFNSSQPIRKTDAFQRIASGPLKVYGPSANLKISAKALTGDASLLIDSVNVARAVPSIPNGGFETPVVSPREFIQAYKDDKGLLKAPSWTFANGAGVQHNGSAFAASKAPEGSQTAVFQNADATFETKLDGFESGVSYRLVINAAARDLGAATLRISLDDKSLRFNESDSLIPNNKKFESYMSDTFKIEGGEHRLKIESISEGCTFVDDLYFEFVSEAE